MTRERWQELKSLFGEVADLEGFEQERFLLEVSKRDPELAHELRGMVGEGRQSWLVSPFPQQSFSEHAALPRVLPIGHWLAERYRIHSFLGSGGMGEVYRAFDEHTDQWIAIKTLRADVAARPEFARQFKRELNLARSVHHENICRVFDIHHAPGPGGATIVFLTMELIEGETLEARISARPLTTSEASPIAQQLMDGLECAHYHGIVHGDLKDSNVMLAPRSIGGDRVVIMDFGLARDEFENSKRTQSLFGTGAIVGTAAYMSPEQLEGTRITQATDIYALGVILFKMVTARLPFEGETPLALALRRMRNSAPSPREIIKDLDRGWEAAILACLEAKADRRPATVGKVRTMLGGGAPRRPLLTRRNFAWVAGLGGAVAIAVTIRKPIDVPNAEAARHLKLAEQFVKRRSGDDLRNAIQEYQRVLKLESRNAVAWAGLAEAWSAMANFTLGDSAACLRQARQAAGKALSLERSARSMGVMGYCLLIDVDQWRKSEPYLREAVQLDPKQANARLWYAAYLGRTGHSRNAIAQLQLGLQEDPMSFALNQQLATEYLKLGEFQKSLDAAQELIRLQPFEGISYLAVAHAYEWLGRYDEGERACDEAAKYLKHPAIDALRGLLEAARGNGPAALRIAAKLDGLWRAGQFEAGLLAKVYARLGDHRRAIEILETGVGKKEASVLGNLFEPEFRVLFDDPAYIALLRRVGLDPTVLKEYTNSDSMPPRG